MSIGDFPCVECQLTGSKKGTIMRYIRPSQPKQITTDYLQAFTLLLYQIDLEAIERTVELLRKTRDQGGTIYIAGNGGSAATASHWVNDLGKATKSPGAKNLRVMSLSDNISWLTALANDEGYERVFSGQLENFARPGDVLIVISASGNSANLLRAVEVAQKSGVKTIALLGFDGGLLKNKVDEYLWLPTERGEYGMVESAHALICHILTDCLANDSATAVKIDGQSTLAKKSRYAPSRPQVLVATDKDLP